MAEIEHEAAAIQQFQGSRLKVFIHLKYYYIVHNTFIHLYNYSKNGEEVHIETIKAY